MTDTILKLEQLSVDVQQQTILSDINLSLEEGDILGLVGPSGCGKTTLLNTIAGFMPISNGQLTLNNQLVVSVNSNVPANKRNIGMIFQDYALFPHLTVAENIGFGLQSLNRDEKNTRINQFISLLKLDGLSKRMPHQLSGGQQQRVAIARSLAPQPSILLLDEPFSNIDARLRHELMIEIRQLLKQLNMSAIFVTHNKDEVFTFADKMAILHKGKLLQHGAPANVCSTPNSWEVADFLQLGSWLPVTVTDTKLITAIGELAFKNNTSYNHPQLLVKANVLNIEPNGVANVKIEHVGLTEQGYHYLVSSLEQSSKLAFSQLSLYCETLFNYQECISLSIQPHDYVLFNQGE